MMTFTSNFRYLQFYQPMVLNSLVVSLIPVAILSLQVFFILDMLTLKVLVRATVMMMVIVEVAVMTMVVLIDIAMAQDNFFKANLITRANWTQTDKVS